jgi:hypothetical protein
MHTLVHTSLNQHVPASKNRGRWGEELCIWLRTFKSIPILLTVFLFDSYAKSVVLELFEITEPADPHITYTDYCP